MNAIPFLADESRRPHVPLLLQNSTKKKEQKKQQKKNIKDLRENKGKSSEGEDWGRVWEF
jgi:hypothetical protein